MKLCNLRLSRVNKLQWYGINFHWFSHTKKSSHLASQKTFQSTATYTVANILYHLRSDLENINLQGSLYFDQSRLDAYSFSDYFHVFKKKSQNGLIKSFEVVQCTTIKCWQVTIVLYQFSSSLNLSHFFQLLECVKFIDNSLTF